MYEVLGGTSKRVMIGMRHMWHKRLNSIHLGVAQFCVMAMIAMMYYPGGTPWDAQTTGYTFWHNALSDLGRTVAYNGQDNPIASPLFNVALSLLGVSTLAGFIVLLRREDFQNSRAQRLFFCGLGASSSLGLIIVGFTPDNLLPTPHMIGVWLWGLCLFVQTLLTLVGRFTSDPRLPPRAITALLFLSIATLLGMGVIGLWSPWVTSAQKIVLCANLAWYMSFSSSTTVS